MSDNFRFPTFSEFNEMVKKNYKTKEQELQEQLAQRDEEIKALREALSQYADLNNWDKEWGWVGPCYAPAALAQEALSARRPEEGGVSNGNN